MSMSLMQLPDASLRRIAIIQFSSALVEAGCSKSAVAQDHSDEPEQRRQ